MDYSPPSLRAQEVHFVFGTLLIEIQQSDWLAAMVLISTDHAVENHVPKTIDNGLKLGLLSLDT